MNAERELPATLVEAIRYFSDPEVTHQCFMSLRWPNGIVCPHCGSDRVTFLPKQRRWECKEKHERRQFSVKTGTVMEESLLPLDKWAVAFWLEVNAKNSISSYELHRALGITQKSAWFMLHRVRAHWREPPQVTATRKTARLCPTANPVVQSGHEHPKGRPIA